MVSRAMVCRGTGWGRTGTRSRGGCLGPGEGGCLVTPWPRRIAAAATPCPTPPPPRGWRVRCSAPQRHPVVRGTILPTHVLTWEPSPPRSRVMSCALSRSGEPSSSAGTISSGFLTPTGSPATILKHASVSASVPASWFGTAAVPTRSASPNVWGLIIRGSSPVWLTSAATPTRLVTRLHPSS
eukprot:scaffold44121_cov26-Phaeocystis_antarctica.AAC.1